MPEFECPRCHKNSLPDPQTGYYESGFCPECEEELDRIDRLHQSGDIDYEDYDTWEEWRWEEWRGER